MGKFKVKVTLDSLPDGAWEVSGPKMFALKIFPSKSLGLSMGRKRVSFLIYSGETNIYIFFQPFYYHVKNLIWTNLRKG